MTLRESAAVDDAQRLHIICERDVGLFSLVQQVVANVPWALAERRVPVVCFGARTCYWTPTGHRGKRTVWEYYFEPLVATHPAGRIPDETSAILSSEPPSASQLGYEVGAGSFVSCHFGDHPDVSGAALPIPYEWDDPSESLRHEAKAVLDRFVRPRPYIRHQVDRFVATHMTGHRVVGVHLRGTDAVSADELRAHRRGSLVLERYVAAIQRLLEAWPDARILVASDAEFCVDHMRHTFPGRVIARDGVRHREGEAAGHGPTGWLMPAYIAADRNVAAQNGEDAVVEYLLLSRCDHLIHNGSSLARTVLLNVPNLPHTNTHGRPSFS